MIEPELVIAESKLVFLCFNRQKVFYSILLFPNKFPLLLGAKFVNFVWNQKYIANMKSQLTEFN